MTRFSSARSLAVAGVASVLFSGASFLPVLASSVAVEPTMNKISAMPVILPAPADDGNYIPLPEPTVRYSFDEAAIRALVSQRSSIGLAKCDRANAMKAIGLENASADIYSVGMVLDGINYSVDVRNCTISGNSEHQTARPYGQASTKKITVEEARKTLDAFLRDSKVLSSMGFRFGEVQVTNTSDDRPMPYALESSASSLIPTSETESTASGADRQYSSVDFVVPTLFDGYTLYTTYGNVVGLSVSVNAEGVAYFSANTLPFSLSNRTADEATADDIVKLVKNGGNSPYYPSYPTTGGVTTVALGAPEKVLVLVEDYRGGNVVRYVSTGMRLVSDRTVGSWSKLPYGVIVSDYSVGNTAGMSIMR